MDYNSTRHRVRSLKGDQMLIIALSAIAYLFTGYTIGKINNGEYSDNTPTKELGTFRKCKRLLLFPISYHRWSDRDNYDNMGSPFRMATDSDNPKAGIEERENYCKVMTFVWPLNFVFAIVGAVQIPFFAVTRIIYGISSTVSQSTKYLDTGAKSLGRIQRKLLPASSSLSSYINEIELCLIDIQTKRRPTYAERDLLESQIQELSKNIDMWQPFLRNTEGQDYAQIQEITQALTKEKDQRRERINNLQSAMGTLTDVERQLEEHAAKLKQCEKTLSLGIPLVSASGEGFIKSDAIAVLAGSTVSSAQSDIAKCKELLAK